MTVIRITAENFETIIDKNPLLLLLCGDSGCAERGEMLGEAVRELLFHHPALSFAVMSPDERTRIFPDEAHRTPCFYFLERGRILGVIAGPCARELRHFVNNHLQKTAVY